MKDGGGVRGLSSLLILDHLMKQIDQRAPPLPCDIFDLIGGTSTGGYVNFRALYLSWCLILAQFDSHYAGQATNVCSRLHQRIFAAFRSRISTETQVATHKIS